MADERKGAWLSPESYERLRSELEEMTTTGRAEIARKIEAARSEGDLRENGGYQAPAKSSRRWRAVSPS